MELKITDAAENFRTWLEKSYIDIELKNELSNASILIVPFENLRDSIGPVFPTGTDYLLQYFQKRLPQEISIDICISDSDYHTFKVDGMHCVHCKAAVEKGVSQLKGVKSVLVDLDKKEVSVKGEYKAKDIKKVVEELGFKMEE